MTPNAQNALNPALLAMLACPSDDHAPLREESHEGADTLVCTFCATRFPIDDGIPVLLLDDATPGPHGVGVAAEGSSAPVVPEPAGAVPAVDVADDEIVAAGPVAGLPFDPRVSPKHALPDAVEDAAPGDPLGVTEAAQVEGVFDTAEVAGAAEDAELATAQVVDVADVVEVADVLVDDDVAPDVEVAPDSPDVPGEVAEDPGAEPAVATSEPAVDSRRPQSPQPGARTLAAALRHRVEHRLAEYEANRGPRRRRGTGR